MFRAADPDLAAADDIRVALAPREGADARRVCAALGFGDSEGLQSQGARRNLRQPAPLLFFAAVTQQRAHRVHSGMSGRAIRSRAMDFLENRNRGAKSEAGSAKAFRDQHAQKPSCVSACTNSVG